MVNHFAHYKGLGENKMNTELYNKLDEAHKVLVRKEKLEKQIAEEKAAVKAKADELEELKSRAFASLRKNRESVHFRVGCTFFAIGAILTVIVIYVIRSMIMAVHAGTMDFEAAVFAGMNVVIICLGAYIAGISLMAVHAKIWPGSYQQEILRREYEEKISAGAGEELEAMRKHIKEMQQELEVLMVENAEKLSGLPEGCESAEAVAGMRTYVKNEVAETIDKSAKIYKRRSKAWDIFCWLISHALRFFFFWLRFGD